MPVNPHDPDPRGATDAARRHRREIELMEQRFRERAERGGAAPAPSAPPAGRVDDRVQSEMQQFFSESARRMEAVAPSLDTGKKADALDTTGEIRRKIEAFFDESAEAAAAPAPARPAGPNAAPAPRRRLPSDASIPIPPLLGLPKAGGPSLPRMLPKDDTGPVPAQATRRAAAAAAQLAAQSDAPPQSAPAAQRTPAAPTPDPVGAPIDLKTALERLRRQTGGGARSFADAAAPGLAPRSAAPPAAPPAQQAPPPAARRATPPVTVGGSAAAAPPPAVPSQPPARRAAATPPAAGRSALPPSFAPPPSAPAAALPPAPAAAPAPAPAPAAEPAPQQRRSALDSDGFDAILAEVEGLVRGTLRDSVSETYEAARDALPGFELRREAAPESESLRGGPISRPLSTVLPRPRDDDDEEGDGPDEAPPGPHDWGVRPADRPRGAWLLEESGEVPPAAAPATSGAARSAPAPTGAARSAASRAASQPVTLPPEVEPLPDDGDEPPVSTPVVQPEPSTGSAGLMGGSYLARKYGDEVAKLRPAVKKLVQKGVVSKAELGDDDDDDDDEVSLDSFKDDRPRGEVAAPSAMRIIEEIRRTRRLMEVLLKKGLVTEDDLGGPLPAE